MLRHILTLAALALMPHAALAQTFPSKAIRIIVPFPPGGSADLVARLVGQRLSENVGQPVLVENRPGADTIIAMEFVAKAPADGYTIGYVIGSALTMNPTLYSKLPYDAAKDYVALTHIANVPLSIAVHPSVPANNIKEFAEYIRVNPGKIFYANGNIISKVASESFARAAGGSMIEISYKGSAPSLQDLLRGTVQMSIDPVIGVMPFVRDGKLKVLALTDSRRAAAFPDIPTVAESGLPGFAFNNWHGMVLPAGTSGEIVNRLHAEIVKAANHPEVGPRVRQLGVEIVASTPEEMATRVRTERTRWDRELKEMGIKLQ
jgi:tripartite-type tricarboxylate transporter receptor subunit TctC